MCHGAHNRLQVQLRTPYTPLIPCTIRARRTYLTRYSYAPHADSDLYKELDGNNETYGYVDTTTPLPLLCHDAAMPLLYC